MENLAFEPGPQGVRVVCLRTTANTDSNAILGPADAMKVPQEKMIGMLANLNFLKSPAVVADKTRTLLAITPTDDLSASEKYLAISFVIGACHHIDRVLRYDHSGCRFALKSRRSPTASSCPNPPPTMT
jgi:hypothetical protein